MAEVEARKKAPPETAEAVSLRMKVVFSFWAVILLLGLPTWLKTTEIYRASLPLDEMSAWSEGQRTLPPLQPIVWIDWADTACAEAERLTNEIEEEILTLCGKTPVRPTLRSTDDNGRAGPKCPDNTKKGPVDPDLTVRFAGEDAAYSFTIRSGLPLADFKYSLKQRAALPKELAKSIYDIYAGETVAHLLQFNGLVNNHPYTDTLSKFSGDLIRDVERQVGRAAKASPSYHLTFSLFSAGGAPSSWDVQTLLNNHIQPLVHALRRACDIETGTQIQLFSPYSPSIQSYEIEGKKGNFLQQSELTSFVNAAEWPLSPSIGEGPTLNFIVYAPSKADTPLGVDGELGGAWIVPQWGGISIVNTEFVEDPETGSFVIPPHLDADALSAAFQTFSSQLLNLLGVVATTHQGQTLPLALRLRSFQRQTAVSLHLRAASSLGSLARLANHLSTIPIPKHVAQLVEDAMRNLEDSAKYLEDGDWNTAIELARSAFRDSEKAFFDKSMVGQVYFPDEHKVAVYMPFLGPIGLPLLVSLLRELKRLLAAFRAKKVQ